MKAVFRITSGLLTELHEDLSRPHEYAFERAAFLVCRSGLLDDGGITILAHSMHSVADEDYEHSNTIGALLGSSAFRRILQYSYNHDVSIFHVHRHEHHGHPIFSRVDVQESAKFVPDFFKVRPKVPHGALLLSLDNISGLIWRSRIAKAEDINKFVVLGHRVLQYKNDRVK